MARRLRSQAWVLADIAAQLNVSKSSVSLWVRDVEFDPVQRPTGTARKRKPNALQRRKQDEIENLKVAGRRQIGELSDRDLLVAGVALYAGEGAKGDGSVIFANSDARLMALFCAWLRAQFDIDEQRLRVRLYLHEGLDYDAATTHWSAITNVPVTQFIKPYRAPADNTLRTTKHVHGCAYLRYSCSHTHRAIMGLVNALMMAVVPRIDGAGQHWYADDIPG